MEIKFTVGEDWVGKNREIAKRISGMITVRSGFVARHAPKLIERRLDGAEYILELSNTWTVTIKGKEVRVHIRMRALPPGVEEALKTVFEWIFNR